MERFVLLVEDNADDAYLIARAFRAARLPASVVHLTSGEEALEFLFARGAYASRVFEPLPAAVFLDLRLTGIGGLEVLSAIREHPTTSAVPVLILTSSDAEADRVAASTARANYYVTKPCYHGMFVADAKAIGRLWLSEA